MRLISFINLIIISLISICLIGTLFFLAKPNILDDLNPPTLEKQLPKRPFDAATLPEKPQGALALEWKEPSLELPPLAGQIHYHGVVLRPDTQGPSAPFQISMQGSDALYRAKAGSPFYLTYEKGSDQIDGSGYRPCTDITGLWLEMVPRQGGKQLDVTVHMKDANGIAVTEPSKYHQFTLFQTEPTKAKQGYWEIGECRVDSTLLLRQKARWTGADLFLRAHGGKDFNYTQDRQRIDFQLNNELYSCFVKQGDYLVWHDGRWHENFLFKGPTCNLPLLAVKKIDDKVINFELWDSDGLFKIPLNLIKAKDHLGMPNLGEELRFVGAKTWAQFILESRSQRLVVKPHDWFVLTSEGWIKLDSAKKIDDFVSLKMQGSLLIFDKLCKQNGKQVLTGHLYNLTRSDIAHIEIPTTINAYALQHAPVPPSPSILEPIAPGGLE